MCVSKNDKKKKKRVVERPKCAEGEKYGFALFQSFAPMSPTHTRWKTKELHGISNTAHTLTTTKAYLPLIVSSSVLSSGKLKLAHQLVSWFKRFNPA